MLIITKVRSLKNIPAITSEKNPIFKKAIQLIISTKVPWLPENLKIKEKGINSGANNKMIHTALFVLYLMFEGEISLLPI
jgi:hypothetical protein